MTRTDYEPLLDRVQKRFQSWTTRFLSYSGRLQLIKSVITSIANFWCSVFRLPQRCLDKIESMCAAFLWSGSPTTTTKSKVTWADLCVPKEEGGLGLRRLKDTSIAYSLSLIWRLLTSRGSYWVTWTKHYLLRYSSFWDIKRHTRGSWIWNKLLKLRPLAMTFIKHSLGNGQSTFFWLDKWMEPAPLIQLVGEVGPSLMGIARNATVASVTRDGSWSLRYRRNPLVRNHVQHILTLQAPMSSAPPDRILWNNGTDNYQDTFSMKLTWDALRHRCNVTTWWKLAWSALSIPRYSFITWLALRDRLPTGAQAVRWGHLQPCVLCGDPCESRDHLFFSCPYAFRIWSQLSTSLLRNNTNPDWTNTTTTLLNMRMPKEVEALTRFLFQAAIYHIWRERNGRIHGRTHNTATNISMTIKTLLTQRLRAKFPTQLQLQSSSLWTTWTNHLH